MSEPMYKVKQLTLYPDTGNGIPSKFVVGQRCHYGTVSQIGMSSPGMYIIRFEDQNELVIISPAWTAEILKEYIKEPLILVPSMVPPSDINAPQG